MDGGRQQDRWKYRSWDRGLFQGDVYERITDKGVAALDNSVVNCVLHPVSPNEEGGVARFSRNNGFRVNWCIRSNSWDLIERKFGK